MKLTTRYIQAPVLHIWNGLMVARDHARITKEIKPRNEAASRVRGARR